MTQVPEQYAKWNPRNHIANWKTPTLLIQGGEDFRLPETQAIGAFNTLQSLNIPSRLVYFESENHWVLNPLVRSSLKIQARAHYVSRIPCNGTRRSLDGSKNGLARPATSRLLALAMMWATYTELVNVSV